MVRDLKVWNIIIMIKKKKRHSFIGYEEKRALKGASSKRKLIVIYEN